MKLPRTAWRIIGLLSSLFLLTMGSLFFFAEDGLLYYGLPFYYSAVTGVLLLLLRGLQNAPKNLLRFGWIAGVIVLVMIALQLIWSDLLVYLWNLTLGGMALVAGTLMYVVIGTNALTRSFVALLTLSVVFVMVLEAGNPLMDKITLGLFVAGFLSCLHVLFSSDAN